MNNDEISARIREAKVADDVPEEEVEVEVQEEPEVEVELTDAEVKAKEAGWYPGGKDKDGNELSAEEFLARKPLFNKIHGLQDKYDKDISELKEMVKSLQDDNKKITVASMQKQQDLMGQLKAAKEKALDDLDTDQVRKIDGQIEEVRENIAQSKQPVNDDEAIKKEWNDAYFGFLKDNSWYDNAPGMAKAADMIAREVMQKNPQTKAKDLYSHVAEKIREEFPDRFDKQSEKPAKTSKVSTSNSRGAKPVANKQVRLVDLPEEERRIVKNMMEMTGKTEEEYLKNYQL